MPSWANRLNSRLIIDRSVSQFHMLNFFYHQRGISILPSVPDTLSLESQLSTQEFIDRMRKRLQQKSRPSPNLGPNSLPPLSYLNDDTSKPYQHSPAPNPAFNSKFAPPLQRPASYSNGASFPQTEQSQFAVTGRYGNVGDYQHYHNFQEDYRQ